SGKRGRLNATLPRALTLTCLFLGNGACKFLQVCYLRMVKNHTTFSGGSNMTIMVIGGAV
ncbi:MAG: hypothetical protein ACQESQ_12335, partial [Bacteroidota bacterium]